MLYHVSGASYFEHQNILTFNFIRHIMQEKGGFNMFEKLQAIVVEELGVDQADVTRDASILDDLGADSLDVVELIMAIEEEFDVTVEDETVQKLKTVGDVLTHIEKEVA